MTIQISDTQRTILTAACARKGGLILPVTASLKGGALKKVIASLLAKGLVEEVPAKAKQDIWRMTDDGVPLTLMTSKIAYATLGIEQAGRTAPIKAKTPARERGDTKQAKVIAMLKRPAGATVEQIVKATDWQPHTVRGFFAGALKKRLEIKVTSAKAEDGKRVYRIAP